MNEREIIEIRIKNVLKKIDGLKTEIEGISDLARSLQDENLKLKTRCETLENELRRR